MPKTKDVVKSADNMAEKLSEKYNSKGSKLAGVVKQASAELLSDVSYYISTQAPTVDYIIGRPGVPAGKLTTIFGREASGKSTLGYHIMAETQRRGGLCILIDSEQRFPRDRAGLMGITAEDLVVIDGATAEMSFEAIEEMSADMHKDYPDLPVTFIYDSLAGSVPQKRMEAEIGSANVGTMAKLVSGILPRVKLKMAQSKHALVIVNQLRSRVQMLDPSDRSTYERIKVMGKSQTMIAEWPLIFESALMLYVHSVSQLGADKAQPTGLRSRVVNRKSGVAPREMWFGEIDIDYMRGIDIAASHFDLMVKLGYLKQSSSWYEMAGVAKKFQRKDFADVMAQHPEIAVVCAEAPTLWLKGGTVPADIEEDPDTVFAEDDDE